MKHNIESEIIKDLKNHVGRLIDENHLLRLKNYDLQIIIKRLEQEYYLKAKKLNPIASNLTIEDLGLTVRTYNILQRAQIKTVNEVLLLTDDFILSLFSSGIGTLRNIDKALEKNGLYRGIIDEQFNLNKLKSMQFVW